MHAGGAIDVTSIHLSEFQATRHAWFGCTHHSLSSAHERLIAQRAGLAKGLTDTHSIARSSGAEKSPHRHVTFSRPWQDSSQAIRSIRRAYAAFGVRSLDANFDGDEVSMSNPSSILSLFVAASLSTTVAIACLQSAGGTCAESGTAATR